MTGEADVPLSANESPSTEPSPEPAAAVAALRSWWDREADEYQAEHGPFLAGLRGGPAVNPGRPAELPARFVWCPEAVDEADVGLLGPRESLVGRRVLEVGAGGGQCSRWLAETGAHPVALDLSARMLTHAPAEVPRVQADAMRLPLAAESFDLACSAYGALPFVPDAGAVLREVARVLCPGGRYVLSTTHPFRWCLPDDPGWPGLRVTLPYFDRRPYLEHRADGTLDYAEYHRTVGDWVRLARAAGFAVVELLEPEWPAELTEEWGGWSPLRGQYLPGTLILVLELPG